MNKRLINKYEKFKGSQPSFWYVAALFLAAILGNLLGFAIFTLLERIL
jgi:hypothetical protein